jgi:hypothetical protein
MKSFSAKLNVLLGPLAVVFLLGACNGTVVAIVTAVFEAEGEAQCSFV